MNAIIRHVFMVYYTISNYLFQFSKNMDFEEIYFDIMMQM